MTALLDRGFDVTALHNHFFWDDPHMFYMHVHGHGTAADLARRLKPAIDLIGHVPNARGISPPSAGTPAPTTARMDTAKIARLNSGPRSPAPTPTPPSPATSRCSNRT